MAAAMSKALPMQIERLSGRPVGSPGNVKQFSFHFAKATDQSGRLEEKCSSARRAPSSYNGRSSHPQQSAGYGCRTILNVAFVARQVIPPGGSEGIDVTDSAHALDLT